MQMNLTSQIIRLGLMLLILMRVHSSLAQQYNYIHYSTKDGLASEVVNHIIQDNDGFLWFATETGLSRFDGKTFKNYTEKDGLPSNEVFGFYLDSQNRLWIISFINELCYYRNGKIYNKHNDPILKKLALKFEVWSLTETKSKDIIIWDEKYNLYKIRHSGGVEQYSSRPFPRLSLDSLGEQSIPIIFVNIPENVRKLIKSYRLELSPRYNVSLHNNIFLLDRPRNKGNKKIIVIDNNLRQLYYFNSPKELRFQTLFSNRALAQTFLPAGAALYDIQLQKQVAFFLPDHIINYIYKDKENNLWFSTQGDGIFKLGNPQVTCYSFLEDELTSPVQFIGKKDGKLYVGDDNGGFWRLKINNIDQNGIPIYTKQKIKVGLSWLTGEMEKQLVNCSSSDFFDIYSGQTRVGIKSLYAFGDTVLKASNESTDLLDTHGRVIKTIHDGRSTCAIKHNGLYYIGTLNGLYIYSASGKLIAKPINDRISSFAPGTDNSLWIASYNKGVFKWEHGRKTVVINQANTSINSNICRCIYYINSSLWIGTDKGINKVNISGEGKHKEVVTYTTSDGLNSNVINTIFVEDSLVYVGTQKGLNCFNEKQAPCYTPSNLKLNNVIVSGVARAFKNKLFLSEKDNNIRFEYSGISFLSGGDIKYQYRLIGLDSQWQTTFDQVLNYPSLPSGKYKLQIKAINKFGVQSDTQEVEFEIEKKMHEKWWFQLATILLVASMVLLASWFRIRHIRGMEERKRLINQKILELEQMALRAQMNPHFIFNCLNSIQSYIVRNDSQGANFYLSQFARLVRLTLDNASRVFLSLKEEVAYLSSYIELEKLQYGSSFEYSIQIAPTIKPEELEIPNMILQPYVENAIKHGLRKFKANGKLLISFQLANNNSVLKCQIEDNGPGIEYVSTHFSRKNYTSKGMSITQQRLSLLNKNSDSGNIKVLIEDLSKYELTGTRVSICFPVRVINPR